MSELKERCWFKDEVSPSECPFILPDERHLRFDRDKRIRRKCIECKRFYEEINQLSGTEDQIFEIMKLIIDELHARQETFRRFQQIFSVNASRMHILYEVLESLHSTLDLKQVAYTVMLAVTAGDGIGFNRGFLLLRDREGSNLVGYIGIGPRDPSEAERIWKEIGHLSIRELVSAYTPKKFDAERDKFKDILAKLRLPLDLPILHKLASNNKALLVRDQLAEHFKQIIDVLKSNEIAIAPLNIRNDIIGLIVADNFITHKPITKDELEFLEIVAYQATLAMTRAFFHEELQAKVNELHRINRLLREYHEEITRMEKMAAVGEVIHRITHDFKNPLTIIGGLARTILDEIEPSHKFYERLKAIVEESDRLMTMLDTVLCEIRARYALERTWWNMNLLVKRLANRFKPILERNNIDLKLELDPNLPEVFIDFKQFENCIENLILNAVDAMPNGGTLKIKTEFREDENEVRLIVEDTGVGIKKEMLDKVFEPFFTTKDRGSGLGLYNCRETIRAHGGKIEVQSIEGHGTKFIISLINIRKDVPEAPQAKRPT